MIQNIFVKEVLVLKRTLLIMFWRQEKPENPEETYGDAEKERIEPETLKFCAIVKWQTGL